jgi:predicted NUDIX family phosphoesterase
MNEDVMVVSREDLAGFIDGRSFDFIRSGVDGIDGIVDVITNRHFFIARATAETSPQYKQIIPYVIIRHDDSYFLLKRTTRQTEARLHHKLSLGIGGHINPDTPTILGGLQKELDEEVSIARPYELAFAGILNDDTTDVGRVHLGAVYVLKVFTPQVVVRETEKMTGAWTPREALAGKREAMETWSQLVYDGLIARG